MEGPDADELQKNVVQVCVLKGCGLKIYDSVCVCVCV